MTARVVAALAAALLVTVVAPAIALDNGKALLPPMGWRSWNCYHASVNQDLMEGVMRAMVARNLTVGGKPTSLADLGFTDVGLDDNWQACGKGVNGSFTSFPDFAPLINPSFPDMKGMVDYGHSLGLSVGFYMNNCICKEIQSEFPGQDAVAGHMEGRVKYLAQCGFDGVKLDGCGAFRNLTWWSSLINATGNAMVIENCHWGGTVPGQTTGDGPCTGTTMPSNCPYSFFRTSGDISANWGSMFHNLQTTTPYQTDIPLARPGTWAYPDMLEVGNLANEVEDRSHFGAWVIVSAPLVLGHDVTNPDINARIWPIISNAEVLAVSQDWAGHPGRLAAQYNDRESTVAAHRREWQPDDACDNNTFPYDYGGQQAWGLNQYSASSAQDCEQHCCDMGMTACTIWQWGTNNQCWLGVPNHFTDNPTWATSRGRNKPPPAPPGSNTVQLWVKPLTGGSVAAFTINNDMSNRTVTIDFKDVFNTTKPVTGEVAVRCLYEGQDLGSFTGSFTTDVMVGHDSRMFKMTPPAGFVAE